MIHFEADQINKYLRFNPWTGHRNYIYELVRLVEPKTIVELGSHYGCSLFAMAQAVKDYNLSSTIYAVDTWEGTGEIGAYDETVFETVVKTKEQCYKSVDLILLKMFFEDAREKLLEGSQKIELLHIDGSHEYDNVKNDFETWIELMSEYGIIMFHDIGKGTNLGSEVYWNEIKAKYKHTIEIDYSWGLGIIFLNQKQYDQVMINIDFEKYRSIENRRNDELSHRMADDYFVIGEKDKYIRELEKWNAIKEQHLKRWESTVKAKDDYINQLQEEKKVIEQNLTDWMTIVKQKDIYISELEEQKVNLSKLVEIKESYIGELEKQKIDLISLEQGKENYIEELEEQKVKLNKLIEIKESYIGELEKQKMDLISLEQGKENYIEELEEQKVKLNKLVEVKEGYIGELEKQKVDLISLLAGKENYIGELEGQKINLNKLVGVKEDYIGELEEQKANLNELVGEREEYIKELEKKENKLHNLNEKMNQYKEQVTELSVKNNELQDNLDRLLINRIKKRLKGIKR